MRIKSIAGNIAHMIKLKIKCPHCTINQTIETNQLTIAKKKCIDCKKRFKAWENVISTNA